MTAAQTNQASAAPHYKHPIRGLLFSQFVGAFNDNAWKLIVFTLATRSLFDSSSFEYDSQMKATLALMVFLIPFLLFSLPAGSLADRNSKRHVIIWTKALEASLMALATASLFFFPSHLILPYFFLGMMGLQSALFGPAKYGILPQVLPYEKLSKGNGFIEMSSMIAIIAGTGLGPMLLALDKGGQQPWLTWTGPLALTIFSLFGLAASFTIPKVKAVRETPIGMVTTIKKAYHSITSDRILLLAILGNVLFWMITSLLGQNVLVYAKTLVKHLEKGELLQGIPPASYGLGIAFGALLGGKLSGERIEYGLIPLGSIGFSIMSLILGLIQPQMAGTVATLILMGIATGFLIVPLKSIVQWRSPKDQRGAVIALGNVFDILGMMVGSLFAAAMAWIGIDLGMTLVISSLIVVVATLWSVKLLPEALTRLVFILLTTTFYKIRINGKENVPKKGPALLVANHLSATDAFFVMAAIDRPVRFVMSETHYNKWWLKPFALAMNAIPVADSGKTTAIKNAMRAAGKPLEKRQLVCVFPEGQVSRTGNMQPFKEGVEEIIKDRNCPIIPVNLDRVWGTIFSPMGGKYIPKRPQSIPHPLTVSFGTPLPADTPFSTIRTEIRKMGCQSWFNRKDDELPIHYHFIRSVWRAPWKPCLSDIENKKISRFKVLTSSIVLARALKETWIDQETVGIMLPPTPAGVMTNIAAALSGKTVVNLNYTASATDLAYCLKEANVRSVITSRKFLQKVNVPLPDDIHVVLLEDVKPHITSSMKITSALMGIIGPVWLIEKVCDIYKKQTVEDLLTIIFTSGSTGRPKGVMLTHFNVSSNVEAVSQVIPATNRKDKLLHTLPLFHSFGYMTMWLGLNHGLPLVLHPNPLDAANIGNLVKDQKVTMMWTTPSFLKTYLPQVSADMFGALRFVLTGAEKLPKKLATLFKNKYGIRPIEGYGTTECSPVIAASTLDIRLPGVYQAGSVKGSVGQPLPGIRVKVVDVTTHEKLPPNEPGLLLVKGPNVMKGYLHHEDLTKEVMVDGWYITGDIAVIDERDFVTITDRLSRFSKIGGEMVPHGRIEEALHAIEDADEQIFVVTSVPSELKGENLAVLHTLEEGKIHSILQKLMSKDLPKIYIPRFDHFVKVENLPLLGSGKLNLREVRKIALDELRNVQKSLKN
jgi:acyl-[acyl-carrier-protein]-phospholipid O-acyltransferase / long-chain-fatty-acid--[acyl-carrier-protein] ligase